jgi:hypothetical protein
MAQGINTTTQNLDEIAKLAKAPIQTDGIGRAVLIVTDQNGNPVPGAFAKLESVWGGDHFCESWGSTGSGGALALNPLHMGKLKLSIKAKGFQTQKIEVNASSLSEPIRVTLVAKK